RQNQDDRENQDDKRLGAGRAQRQQGEEPQERPLRPRVRAAQRGIGGPRRTLGTNNRRDHYDNHNDQRREEHVLEHRLAQERHALLELFFVISVVSSGIHRFAGGWRSADPALKHEPKMNRQKQQQRPRNNKDVYRKETAKRVAADVWAAE